MQATEYDLFISYADADRAWVEGYLLDALQQANVRYLVETAFTPGAPRIAEFERAIEQSDLTLLVLSDAYLANDVTEFIRLLGQSYGLDKGIWPVIPMIRDETLELPPSLSALVPLKATDEDESEKAIERLCQDLQRSVPDAPSKPECPYLGMRPFSEENSDRFFGRDDDVKILVDRLRHHNFVSVIGPSGSGKSSLVFAGLIPALERSGLFGDGKWLIRKIRPGEEPLAALKTALGSDLADPTLAVTTGLATEDNARRLLLVVDQFEEVFTQAEQEAVPFQDVLLGLLEIPDCYVILTVRADFYPELMESMLWDQIQISRLEIVPLNAEGLREAITKPAEKVKVFIESVLVERLVADAAEEPGVLPLVQEVMVQLWENIERRYLPLRAYDTLVLNSTSYENIDGSNRKGLQAVIANHADSTVFKLPEKQQQIARRIFLRLIQFGEGSVHTRRQQSVEQLRSFSDDPRLFKETLNHLTDCRLLTLSSPQVRSSFTEPMMKEAMEYLAENQPLALSGSYKVANSQTNSDIYVDIAHEALISGWPALDIWINQRWEAEQIRRRLVYRAKEWERLQGKGGLLDEVELAEAGRWLSSPDADELGYDEMLLELVEVSDRAIQEAKEREEARRQRELKLIQERLEEEKKVRKAVQSRNRTLIYGIGGVVTVTLGLMIALKVASQRQVTTLALLSESQLSRNDQLEALMVGVKAVKQLKWWMPNRIHVQAVATLQQAVYETQELNRLEGHLESVNSISFSPDGKILASASDDHTIVLWNQDGSKLNTLRGHKRRVRGITFSPDGKLLASASADKTVKLWDSDGKLLETVEAHDSHVNHVSFSPNGQMFASASRDGTVKLWHFTRGKQQGTENEEQFSSSPVCCSELKVSDLCKKAHDDWVNYVSFSPDGKILATSSNDKTIKLWNVKECSLLKSLEGHEDYVTSVSFSPDGQMLASTSLDKTVRLWNVTQGKFLTSLKHNHLVKTVSFSPDGKMLASGSDKKVLLWDIEGGVSDIEHKPVAVLDGHSNDVSTVKFSPDGKLIASGSLDNTIKFWSIEANHHIIRYNRGIDGARFSPNGKIIAIPACDGKIYLSDSKEITSRAGILDSEPHGECIKSISFSPNGQRLASASDDNTIKLWDVAKHKLLETLNGHNDYVTSVSFSPNGRILASASGDQTIKLWNVENGKLLNTLTRKGKDSFDFTSVSFSPNGKLLASGSDDSNIDIWRLDDIKKSRDSKPLKTFKKHQQEIAAVSFSPDSKMLASASWDRTIKLWDVNKGVEIETFNGHRGGVTDVNFSRDGKTLASSSTDKTLKLWSVKDGFLIKTLPSHQSFFKSVQFSPDSKALLSSDKNQTVI
ncbi:MAG: TIR domain-containing protein, partial [Moorea sp. SIO3I7]|nr:TIR domain-containing protein [Moorena sp. SIO3I7]